MKVVRGEPLDPALEPFARLFRRWHPALDRATPESRLHLAAAEQAAGLQFPRDYVALMTVADGGEGFVEPEGYLVLTPASKLLEDNHDAAEFYPGCFLIGSDGAGEAVALRRGSDGRVELVLTPYIGRPEEDALSGGWTLEEFLELYGTGKIWRHRAGGVRSRD